MSDMAPTYTKSFLLWDKEKDPIPLGIPQLLATPTKEYDVDKDLLRKRDREMKLDTDDERRNRADIPYPNVLSGADAWANGETIILQAKGKFISCEENILVSNSKLTENKLWDLENSLAWSVGNPLIQDASKM